MAVLTIYVPPVFVSGLGIITNADPTLYRVVSGSVTLEYYGTGFTYQGPSISGGTITGSSFYDSSNGGLQYQLTGTNHSASIVDQITNNLGGDGLAAFLFNGDDTIFGSGFSETFLRGWAGNDYILGGGGNDLLDGGGIGQLDTLIGGTGNDTYEYYGQQLLVELPGEGTDLIKVIHNLESDFILPADFENLTLDGNALNGTGNSANNFIEGNNLSNHLRGLDGNDTLHAGLAGSGEDYLEGGAGNDSLIGHGHDTLDGGSGADTMQGGDTFFVVDNLADVIVAIPGGGTVLLQVPDYSIPNLIRSIVLGNGINTAIGNAQDNSILGNPSDNTLEGGGGADTLDGAGGTDVLKGGIGNDTYLVNDDLDSIVEIDGEGTDLAYSSINYTLPDQVENLTLAGGAALNATGNTLSNTLTGNAAANKLNGGQGIDTLIGGDGNDVYYVDERYPDSTLQITGQAGDIVTMGNAYSYALRKNNAISSDLMINGVAQDQDFNGSIDFVSISAADWNLQFGTKFIGDMTVGTYSDAYFNYPFGVEGHPSLWVYKNSFISTGATYGSFVISYIGYSDGVLTKFVASFEQSAGVAGAPGLTGSINYDRLSGTIDSIVESQTGGIDKIVSQISMNLPEYIETLALAGTGNLEALGNDDDNILTGNTGNNLMHGSTGTDIMAGGPGDDTYVIFFDRDDVIMELPDSGTDQINTWRDYNLMQAWHVENLTLVEGSSATQALGNWLNNTIFGNNLSNTISGDRGNDTLDGKGGADILIGGAGNDYLVWDPTDLGLQGGDGIDTLVFQGDSLTLNLFSIDNSKLSGIEKIALKGTNQTVVLSLQDLLDISESSDNLTIDGDSEDHVILIGEWASGAISDGYSTYSQGIGKLLVDSDITVGFI